MRAFWQPGSEPSGIWLAPAAFGVLLIVLGLVLYAHPQLLAYFVAGVFVLAGCGLLGVAWRARRRVTYRRVDGQWGVAPPADEPEGR